VCLCHTLLTIYQTSHCHFQSHSSSHLCHWKSFFNFSCSSSVSEVSSASWTVSPKVSTSSLVTRPCLSTTAAWHHFLRSNHDLQSGLVQLLSLEVREHFSKWPPDSLLAWHDVAGRSDMVPKNYIRLKEEDFLNPFSPPHFRCMMASQFVHWFYSRIPSQKRQIRESSYIAVIRTTMASSLWKWDARTPTYFYSISIRTFWEQAWSI